MTKFGTRLAEQRGIALPVVMLTLLVVSLLATAIASQSLLSSHDSNRDRNSVRALSAAQAGLATANYRLNVFKPADNQCVTNVASAPNSGADCTITESVGNGAGYTYYVTQKIATANGCDS